MSKSGGGRVRMLAEFLSSSEDKEGPLETGASASDAHLVASEPVVRVERELRGMRAPEQEGRGDWGPNQIRVPGSVPGAVFRTILGDTYSVYEGRMLVAKDYAGPGAGDPEATADGPWSGACVWDSPDGKEPNRIDVYRFARRDQAGPRDELAYRLWFNVGTDEMRVPPAFSAPHSLAVLVYVPLGSEQIPKCSTCFRAVRGATVHGVTGADRPWRVTRVDTETGARLVAWAVLSADGQQNPDMELVHEIMRGAALDMAVAP